MLSSPAVATCLQPDRKIETPFCVCFKYRCFLAELTPRLNEWSPAQNVGDIFIKLGQQFQTYANFFNNYAVILKTIDKVRMHQSLKI